jgi:hypothetical protein
LSVEVEGEPDAVTVRADADESRYGLDVLVFNRNKVPEMAVNGDVG